MADISITPANVVPGVDATIRQGTAGATITAGQIVYLDPTDNRYKLADADSATAAARSPAGIALHGASAGQPLQIIESGTVTIGGTLSGGVAYYVSKTAGGIAPVADITGTGTYPTIIGIAASTTVLRVARVESGFSL